MDPRERFSATVDAYVAHRPDYPQALLDHVLSWGPRVVDVGSGTGILARQLAAAGGTVIGVEPNDAMRDAATRAGGGPRYQTGHAEALGVVDDGADVVVGAQAFHWFDLDTALPELERVATRRVVAAWNVRCATGFSAAYDEVISAFSSDYATVPKADPTLAALRARRPEATSHEADHAQAFDLDGVLGRAWSSSYVVHGVSDRAGFDAALARIFAEYQVGDRVRMTYVTRWLSWSPQQGAATSKALPEVAD